MNALSVSKALIVYEDKYDIEIAELRIRVRAMQEAIDSLEQEFDELIQHYRRLSPDLCALMADLMSKLRSQEEPVKEKKQAKKAKKRVKEQFRRVSALTHPDKTLGMDEDVRKQLTAIFLEAKVAYDKLDLATLMRLTDTAARIRAAASVNELLTEFIETVRRDTPREVKENKEDILNILKKDYSYKVAHYESLKTTTMWFVKLSHDAGDYGKALELHRILFMENIHVIGRQLQAQAKKDQAKRGNYGRPGDAV